MVNRTLEDVMEIATTGDVLKRSLENWWMVVQPFFSVEDDEEGRMGVLREWVVYAGEGRPWLLDNTGEGLVFRKREARKVAAGIEGAKIVNAADWYTRLPWEYRHPESKEVKGREQGEG